MAKTFAGKNVDGPVLYGYSGGALGTKQGTTQKIALRWDANGKVIIGNESIELRANNTITASNTINATANVTYKAGEEISFEAEFEVIAGAEFEAYIEPTYCSGNVYARQGNPADSSKTKGENNNSDTAIYSMVVPMQKNVQPMKQTSKENEIAAVKNSMPAQTMDTKSKIQSPVTIQPNPSRNGIFSISGLPSTVSTSITLYNVLGEAIFQFVTISSPSFIEISNYPKGLYFVKIQNAEKVFVEKVVSQ